MDFNPSVEAASYLDRVRSFMDEWVLPAEPRYAAERAAFAAAGDVHGHPLVVEELKERARAAGLWNLFLPAASGLSNVDYAPLAEAMGRNPFFGPEVFNCAAPDTGNIELLEMFGTPEQKERWLEPLLAGEIRSAYAMTEPEVASSDATNIQTRIRRDGGEYVITGRKWWISGAADARCAVLIVMGKTDPDAPRHEQQSMILVPIGAPGVRITRSLPVFGYHDQHGHCDITFDDVRVPAENLIAAEGRGFAIAQARLGPGRVHHAMRAIGMGERAMELMCARAKSRTAFGGPLAEQGVVQALIAESRMDLESARLMVLKTAWLIDRSGAKAAAMEIAAIKVLVPRAVLRVLDRAIEIFGAAGVSDDFPLAELYARVRTLRIVDGPDAVHIRTVARTELRRPSLIVQHGAGSK
jgi:acyl-CoA dehydrogenase